jgi:hypothetical protein
VRIHNTGQWEPLSAGSQVSSSSGDVELGKYIKKILQIITLHGGHTCSQPAQFDAPSDGVCEHLASGVRVHFHHVSVILKNGAQQRGT